jgi:hypothetical protein
MVFSMMYRKLALEWYIGISVYRRWYGFKGAINRTYITFCIFRSR